MALGFAPYRGVYLRALLIRCVCFKQHLAQHFKEHFLRFFGEKNIVTHFTCFLDNEAP